MWVTIDRKIPFQCEPRISMSKFYKVAKWFSWGSQFLNFVIINWELYAGIIKNYKTNGEPDYI